MVDKHAEAAMPKRSPQADLDLLIAEFQALADNNPRKAVAFGADIATGDHLNNAVSRLESLLDEDLSHLKLKAADRYNSNINDSNDQRPIWAYSGERFSTFCQAALAYARSASTRRSPTLDERLTVLATLVMAYNSDSRTIRVTRGDGRHLFHHSKLTRDFNPDWSHIEALAREGLIHLTRERTHFSIMIPSSVLQIYQQGDAFALQVPNPVSQTRAIAESPVTPLLISGSNHNIVLGSTQGSVFQANQSVIVETGNWESLRGALESQGVRETPILSLKQAIDDDLAELKTPLLGPRTMGWLKAIPTHVGIPIGTDVAAGLILRYLGVG